MPTKLEKSKRLVQRKRESLEDAITRHKVSLAALESRFADYVAAVQSALSKMQELAAGKQ